MDRFEYIKAALAPELETFNDVMQQALRSRVPLANEVVHYFQSRSGKCVRPIVTLLAAKMFAHPAIEPKSYAGAAALEMLHCASLMHDDVVDDSNLRRGAKTIHRIWDNRVAILMGDFFLSKSLASIHAVGSQEVVGILASMVTRLAEGELSELEQIRTNVLDEAGYFRMIGDKTASLFAACMKVGALTAGASAADAATMGEIGERMGIVFQMRDDLFDYQPSAEMGKPSAHDIREGKVTLPLLHALATADTVRREEMRQLVEADAMTEADAARLVDFAVEGGGVLYAQRRMAEIAAEAQTMLAAFPDTAPRRALSDLIDYFQMRTR